VLITTRMCVLLLLLLLQLLLLKVACPFMDICSTLLILSPLKAVVLGVANVSAFMLIAPPPWLTPNGVQALRASFA